MGQLSSARIACEHFLRRNTSMESGRFSVCERDCPCVSACLCSPSSSVQAEGVQRRASRFLLPQPVRCPTCAGHTQLAIPVVHQHRHSSRVTMVYELHSSKIIANPFRPICVCMCVCLCVCVGGGGTWGGGDTKGVCVDLCMCGWGKGCMNRCGCEGIVWK